MTPSDMTLIDDTESDSDSDAEALGDNDRAGLSVPAHDSFDLPDSEEPIMTLDQFLEQGILPAAPQTPVAADQQELPVPWDFEFKLPERTQADFDCHWFPGPIATGKITATAK